MVELAYVRPSERPAEELRQAHKSNPRVAEAIGSGLKRYRHDRQKPAHRFIGSHEEGSNERRAALAATAATQVTLE